MSSRVFKGPFPVFSGNFDGELAPYFLPLFHEVIPTLHQCHHRCGLLLYKQYTYLAVPTGHLKRYCDEKFKG
jgi:hypothetical protein